MAFGLYPADNGEPAAFLSRVGQPLSHHCCPRGRTLQCCIATTRWRYFSKFQPLQVKPCADERHAQPELRNKHQIYPTQDETQLHSAGRTTLLFFTALRENLLSHRKGERPVLLEALRQLFQGGDMTIPYFTCKQGFALTRGLVVRGEQRALEVLVCWAFAWYPASAVVRKNKQTNKINKNQKRNRKQSQTAQITVVLLRKISHLAHFRSFLEGQSLILFKTLQVRDQNTGFTRRKQLNDLSKVTHC